MIHCNAIFAALTAILGKLEVCYLQIHRFEQVNQIEAVDAEQLRHAPLRDFAAHELVVQCSYQYLKTLALCSARLRGHSSIPALLAFTVR